MIKDRKALKLALEALEWNMAYLPTSHDDDGTTMAIEAVAAIKEALAQPEQKQTGIREIRVTETVKQEQEQEPVVFARRWKLAVDGFGLQRDDDNGNYVDIDDALSVLHHFASMQSDLTEQDRKSYQKGHNDGVAHHKQAVKAAQPEQDLIPKDDLFVCGQMGAHVTRVYAQPEQEPMAYLCENAVGHKYFRWKKPSSTYKPITLYTTPSKREWVGLTDDEVDLLEGYGAFWVDHTPLDFAKLIEAKLKEKNT